MNYRLVECCGEINIVNVIDNTKVKSSTNISFDIARLILGAYPDLLVIQKYLLASGIHNKFAYSTNSRYMFPKLGSTWRWLGKNSANYGNLVGASLKQILASSL